MKNLVNLWQRTAADAAVQCRTSAIHDINTVMNRFEHEGIELLTLSLPEIGKAFERSLDQGRVTDTLLSLSGKKRGFPSFLRNFHQLVFDRSCGLLLDDPSIDAIQAIRQLTLMFSKVLLPCTRAREEKAFLDFIKCEQEMDDAKYDVDSASYASLRRISSMLFSEPLSKVDNLIDYGLVVPRHGPGVTADRLTGNRKYHQWEWTERLETVFPSLDFLFPSPSYHPQLDKVQILDPGSERPVRVVQVPKTLKTPRIIAIEPTCMQYTQQGIMECLVAALEARKRVTPGLSPKVRHVLWRMIGITDQVPNQSMACEGSLSGDLATLDLSEASDRVSLKLVTTILEPYGNLLEAVLATRSVRASVPGHGDISLTKFASMGSALTFPMEVIVFLTLVFYGIQLKLGRPLSEQDIVSYSDRVRVYGDDIIVPTDCVDYVVKALELFGSKVNHNKSFWTGRFRESCGKEYFDGHDVSICRVRRVLPSQRSDVQEIASLVAFRNLVYKQGYWGTARYLDPIIERLVPFPMVLPESPVLGRESVLGYSEDRQHSDLQVPLVWGAKLTTRPPLSQVLEERALLKFFLKRGFEPLQQGHLERQGRANCVGMNIGWHRST